MKVLEMQGKTVDDATKKAMAKLKISDISSVTVETVDEGKSGIFGFGVSKPALVRVYYNESAMDVGGVAKDVLMNIVERMNIDCTVKDIKEGESKVYLEMESKKSSGLLIGRQGRTLEALQFMINLLVNHKTGNEKKIILDIEEYREKREKALKKMSRDIAQNVVRMGKPQTLEPMNPFERWLVHLALQGDSRVTTVSEGEGIYRKITIMPADSHNSNAR